MEKVKKMESLSTGIEGLDILIDGGYPKGKSILLTGPPGSGKTILGLHFLHKSCESGKKCILILTRELTEDVLLQSKTLGMDLEPFKASGQLQIKNIFEDRINKLKSVSRFGKGLCAVDTDIIEYLSSAAEGADVVVIDNIGMMVIAHEAREFADKFSSISIILLKRGCTSLFIMDDDSYALTYRLPASMVFGNMKFIVKENLNVGRTKQYIYIQKMRNKPVPIKYSLYTLTQEGIKIISSLRGR